MIALTIAEVAQAVGADPAALAAEATPIEQTERVETVVVDSRQVGPGTLFVALPGERVDGHDYVVSAQVAGAVASITTRPVPGARCLVVPDAQAALGRLARRVVDLARSDQQDGLQVVGLTGSAGKTSTKDLIAQVLEPLAPTVAPQGSFNNEIGLPLTACLVTPATRYLVAEMGARGVGHIRYLCEITPPDLGLVLNIGSAHLGEFGSREVTARAKGELVEALPAHGTALLNAADPLVIAMADRTSARVVAFDPYGELAAGSGPAPEVGARGLEADDLGRFRFDLTLGRDTVPVALGTVGRQQVANAVAAGSVAYALGIAADVIGQALSDAVARSHWRMELTERADGVVVLNDAYNANPESMHAALQALTRLGAGRRPRFPQLRTWAVLGDMLELGEQSEAAHRQLGATAAGLGVSRVVAIGQNAASTVTGAGAAGSPDDGGQDDDRGETETVGSVGSTTHAEVAADKDAAATLLADQLRPGDVVLVKASRGMGLETVAAGLFADDHSGPVGGGAS